tara:strand:- start:2983 stop:3348 length:366 start_codon:yes stop_codon:yes gene_type:complete
MRVLITSFIILLNLNFANANTVSNRENEIFKNLRCLICQGQSVADSNSEFAQTVKLVVKDQIKKGKSNKEIYGFLVDKYGEWIVYMPQFNKYNFLLWSLPYVVFLAGGFLIFLIIRKGKEN